MQVLAEQLVGHIHQSEHRQFVAESLAMTDAVLAGQPIDPDELYSRLESLDDLDEVNIFTLQLLDTQTYPEVWDCIEEAIGLVCLINYEEHGRWDAPPTLGFIVEELVDDFFLRYRQILTDLSVATAVERAVRQDARIDLDDPWVRDRFSFLFSPEPAQ